MLRLGLVGFGRWGKNYINACKLTLGKCDIKIVCRQTGISEIGYSADFTSSPSEVFRRGLDGVIIATPPDCHFYWAKKCIEHKIPFLIEKPLTLSRDEGDELINLARSAEVPFQVNLIHLYNPYYLRLRDVVRSWSYESLNGPRPPSLNIVSVGGNNGPYRNYDSYTDYSPHDISMILGLLEPSDWKNINYSVSVDKSECEGTNYRLEMGNDFFRSRSVVGNGFRQKNRYFSVKNLSDDGGMCTHYDTIPRLRINDVETEVNPKNPPLANSVSAFCGLIYGITDWRNDIGLYELVHKISTEAV